MQSLAFTSLISKPTRFLPNDAFLPSLLDQIWTNCLLKCQSGIILTGITDHCPTFVHLECPTVFRESFEIQYRIHNETNFQNFYDELSKINWDQKLVGGVDERMSEFINNLNMVYCTSFPIKIKTISYKRYSKPWINSEIMSLIKTKSKYFKLLKLGFMDRNSYNSFKNRVTTFVRRAKETYYRNLFESNRKNSKKIWDSFKLLFDRNKKSQNITEIILGNSIIKDNEDICNAFNIFFFNGWF